MLVVKVLPKGQITLPKELRKAFQIQEGDTLLLEIGGDQIILKKGKTIFDFIGSLPNLGIPIDEIRGKALAGGEGADE